MTNDALCDLLKDIDKVWSFLKSLQSKERGFNGDMFKLTEEQFEKILQNALNVIISNLYVKWQKSGLKTMECTKKGEDLTFLWGRRIQQASVN